MMHGQEKTSNYKRALLIWIAQCCLSVNVMDMWNYM